MKEGAAGETEPAQTGSQATIAEAIRRGVRDDADEKCVDEDGQEDLLVT